MSIIRDLFQKKQKQAFRFLPPETITTPVSPYIPPPDPWTTVVSDKMSIEIEPQALLKLHAMESASNGNEFSGLGFIEMEGNVLKVYDVVLLDIGTYAFTVFNPSKIVPLLGRPDASKMKLWFH